MFEWVASDENRPWIRWALLIIAAFAAITLVTHWADIKALALSDTDDNLRLVEVRDWLAGQGWYDLRQHRMEPPAGADIHWSRIPDLPIAALILLLKPLLGVVWAEKIAVALAPLVPAVILFLAVAATTRRVAAKGAWPLALVAVMLAPMLIGNFAPLSIDHHNWQLAMMALAMLGLVDPRPARGGLIMGAAMATSLAIGLEMIIFLALMGAVVVLGWVADRDEKRRMVMLGVSAAGIGAPMFLLFASEANRALVCDAFSPVWLADLLLGGALLVAIAWKSPADWRWRLGLAALAGIVLAAFHALAFPNCIHRLEGVSETADKLWLSRVDEAKSITKHGIRMAMRVMTLPIVGIVGYALLAAHHSGRRRFLAIALGFACLVATLLLFWQVRLGASAQLLAVPGAVGLMAVLLPRLEKSSSSLVRVLGVSFAFILATGALPLIVSNYLPAKKGSEKAAEREKMGISRAQCGTEKALAPLAALPKGHVYTFIDMAPRVLVETPHTTVTGPYHRNHEKIVENLLALRLPPDEARVVIEKSGADYLLICRGQVSVIGRRKGEEPGLTGRLDDGERIDWLEPVPQYENAPNLLYRVKARGSS